MKDFSKPFDELRTRAAEELLLEEIDKTLKKKKLCNLGSIYNICQKKKTKFRSTFK